MIGEFERTRAACADSSGLSARGRRGGTSFGAPRGQFSAVNFVTASQ